MSDKVQEILGKVFDRGAAFPDMSNGMGTIQAEKAIRAAISEEITPKLVKEAWIARIDGSVDLFTHIAAAIQKKLRREE